MPYRLILTSIALAMLASAWAQDDQAGDDAGWDDDAWEESWDDDGAGQVFSGFVEGGLGSRLGTDALVGRALTLQETRLRLETQWDRDWGTIGLKADLLYDGIERELHGDFRDLTVAFSPASSTDLKLGRQVLTWGTGDLLFLNDLFPKDFVSFFSGRDDEYLKAPSNSVRASYYGSAVNVDLAWTPVFTPDEYLTGERYAFFYPLAGTTVAPEPPLGAIEPGATVANGEFALRFFKTVRGVEYAAYAYRGFFKQPNAFEPSPPPGLAPPQPTFAPLSAIGGSLRRTLGAGLINAEFSWYLSRDDRSGTDPFVPNDQVRLLLGYEREAVTNLTIAVQWYLEWTQDHDELLANSPFSAFEPRERRNVFTNRINYRAMRDKLNLSLFTFFSPSDQDYYLRPQVGYRYSDSWTLSAGANLFGGRDNFTFFGQLEDASNVYARIRFNY